MANSLNLNSVYYYFRNLSITASIIEFQKSKLAFHDFDQAESGRKIILRVYFHPVVCSITFHRSDL